jgi:hypothetical protein
MIVVASEWILPPDEKSLSEQMLDIMVAAAPDVAADENEGKRTAQKATELYRLMSGYSGVLSFGADQQGMRGSGIYLTDKPQAFFDGFPALWKVSVSATKAMTPWLSMEAAEELETIASVKARVFRFKVAGGDDEELDALLKSIYGESTAFLVAPHAEGMAYAMGPGEVARQDLEKLLTKKGRPLSDDPQVAGALKKLSPKPQVLALLDLPSLLAWSFQFSGMPVAEMPKFEVPKDCPFVSFGMYLDEAECSAELFVPAKAVKVIVEWTSGPSGGASESEPF